MGGDDVGGVSTEAIPPELCGIVLWTNSSRAEYIHFIYQKRLDATTTYDVGHSVTFQAPNLCVLHWGCLQPRGVIHQLTLPCSTASVYPAVGYVRLYQQFNGMYFMSSDCYCPKLSTSLRYIPKLSCYHGQS